MKKFSPVFAMGALAMAAMMAAGPAQAQDPIRIGGIYLMLQMRDNAKLQDCVASGRRNCVPVEASSSK